MSLTIGIVGLPNVGKSTLFNALTKKSVPAENYPFCTIDPSVGVVAVPDERIAQLSKLSESKKTIPPAVEFVDIAGLVKGAAEGAGLGNQFLSHIREVHAIAEVVRIFEDDKVIHVDGGIDPVRDIEVINLELVLADLQTVSKRLVNVERDAKHGDKAAAIEAGTLGRIKTVLEDGKLALGVSVSEEETPFVTQLNLLTRKPILYVLNKKTGGKNLDEQNDERFQKLLAFFKGMGAQYTIVDAGTEHDLSKFEGEEAKTLRGELGAGESGVDRLIAAGYSLLGLMTFFTTGEDETRGWTTKKNATAPVAGTAIHTDFREKFIRAEVVFWKDLVDAGSYKNAREKGLVRTEGRDYIVKDGDVIEFRI